MSPARSPARSTATRRFTGVCAAALLAAAPACAPGPARPRPLLTGEARSLTAPDPSPERPEGWRIGWDAVDAAVAKGAIEHLVVATPVEAIGDRFRTYTLLGPQDQPGELVVERTADGLSLTVRLGRFGLPDLERKVLSAVRKRLRDPA